MSDENSRFKQQSPPKNISLIKKISKEILDKGPISFARYMQLALYTPGLGYYSSGQQKFGATGDFITAPECSALFSHCVARQCEQVLRDLEQGVILELGAGSGVMAIDILLVLEKMSCLPKKYFILELSAELQARQQESFSLKAPHLLSRVQWLERMPAEPIQGVVLANEVMDAMPVHKFLVGDTLQEYYVDYQDEKFIWHFQKASAELEKAVAALNMDLDKKFESEINLLLPGWIASLSDSLQRGLVLLIDYGFPRREYYHPDRHMGTIMCHYQHRSHPDPLLLTGLQDITAHVDFTAIAESAADNGFEVEGYVNQAAFLINCGITDLLEKASDEVTRFNWSSQVKLLTLPSEMGELFKVIALTKGLDQDLLGFQAMDQLERL